MSDLLTIEQASAQTRISDKRLWAAVNDGEIEYLNLASVAAIPAIGLDGQTGGFAPGFVAFVQGWGPVEHGRDCVGFCVGLEGTAGGSVQNPPVNLMQLAGLEPATFGFVDRQPKPAQDAETPHFSTENHAKRPAKRSPGFAPKHPENPSNAQRASGDCVGPRVGRTGRDRGTYTLQRWHVVGPELPGHELLAGDRAEALAVAVELAGWPTDQTHAYYKSTVYYPSRPERDRAARRSLFQFSHWHGGRRETGRD